jgi:N-acyl-D-amino-acid deacylase
MHDLVIRGGTIVDGTGSPPRVGDVAVDGAHIAAVGGAASAGRREIDARGLLVAPGWVDIHTHYDGQATWDPYLTPSSWHGVTTVVMGNCGVGFAPARPDRHDWLIGLMEGVEDIPGTALAEGIRWSWERFPEYLDALAAMPRAVDVGTQVPHGAVRAYVMGQRGAKNEPATADDIASMAAIVHDGITAGALGFTTSRTLLHRAIDGEPVPGTFAAPDELVGIGRALGDAGHGVLELASDLMPEEPELAWMERVSAATGRPITFACLQNDADPDQWRRLLDATDRAAARGAYLVPQVAARPTSLLLGLQGTLHPFVGHATYRALAHLPLAERVARLRDPETRRRMLAEQVAFDNPVLAFLATAFHKLFPLGDPPDYEPPAEASIAGVASRPRRSRTTSCSSATVASCSICRSSTTRRSTSSPSARCCSTPAPSSVSPTVAPTAASSATPARPRSCSRTGRGTVAAASGCRSSIWYAARRTTRPPSTACVTGACWRRA